MHSLRCKTDICSWKLSAKVSLTIPLHEKYPNTEFLLVCIFLRSEWIRGDTSYLSVFSPNVGKCGPVKTPYLDTFHTVRGFFLSCSENIVYKWRTMTSKMILFKFQFWCSLVEYESLRNLTDRKKKRFESLRYNSIIITKNRDAEGYLFFSTLSPSN